MNIEILGMGCEKCKKLYTATEQAVNEKSINAHIKEVKDIKQIMQYGIMSTPALVIDGKVKISGKVLSKDEIKQLL
ncbi:thioredoxin family protein [Pectinatus brassicae]|uniref:Small redox-active disulfide protein 2 n=1 Tax=Pectinatus brassicae TaxID=862415 RepID=A0A840UW07_9FIRM|nr:thioredoxin family protein [Pectinatus brassicae]MBB5336615.1 small redox-active disulfide protein 2 [Pectinatus brassicae]